MKSGVYSRRLHFAPFLTLLAHALCFRLASFSDGAGAAATACVTAAYLMEPDGMMQPVVVLQLPDGLWSQQHQPQPPGAVAPATSPASLAAVAAVGGPLSVQQYAVPVPALNSLLLPAGIPTGPAVAAAPRQQQAMMARALSILDKASLIVTLVDLQTGPIFQNALTQRCVRGQ
jgi:hypothetical protein